MRPVGVNKTYLILTLDDCVVGAIMFVDDYRPDGKYPIDRRYAKIETSGGLIWYSDTKKFKDADEGNDFYIEKKQAGWEVGTETQYREFVDKMARLTY